MSTEHGSTPESVKREIKDILDSPYESRALDKLTAPGVKEQSRPFTGSNFQAALRDLEGRMREAASNLEFEGKRREHRSRPNARLRDEIKRMKRMDLEFANEVLTAEGEAVDTAAPKRWRAEANAEKAERFRKGR